MEILLDVAGYIFAAMAAMGVLMTVIWIIGAVIEIVRKKEPFYGLEFLGALLPLFIAAVLFVAAWGCFNAKGRHLKSATKTETAKASNESVKEIIFLNSLRDLFWK